MNDVTKRIFFVALIACLGFKVCESKKEISAVKTDVKNVEPLTQEAKAKIEPEILITLNEIAEKVKIGETEIQIATYKTLKPTPMYFRPHENEATASDATKEILRKYGGTFVELKSKGDRLISFSLKNRNYTFDPNRIFTAVGIKKTLNKNGSDTTEAEQEVSSFVNMLFSKFLTNTRLIIAVHNNTDKEPLSVQSYKNSPEAASVNINPNRDSDDFFYVTTEAHFKFLKEKGFNVVLQNIATVADDGSLSVYCGRKGVAYINVESEHGHLQQQIEMIQAIQEIAEK